jgi:rubrerythrin
METKLLESVKFALEMEKKGHDLYTKTARETDHPIIASTFLSLAQRELEHIRRIETLYNEVSKGTIDYRKIKEVSVPVEKQQILNSIMENLKDRLQVKPQAKITAVYEVALQLERDGFNYYKRLASELSDPVLVHFFELLSLEENEHFAIIQESQLYLDRPGDWFWGKEHWIEEGG